MNAVDVLTGTLQKNVDVLKRDKVIIAIGKKFPRKSAQLIYGKAKYLIHVLSDMHIHIPQDSSISNHDYFLLYVLNGVTNAISMRGRKKAFDLRDSIRNKQLIGPELYLNSPTLWAGAYNPEKADSLLKSYQGRRCRPIHHPRLWFT